MSFWKTSVVILALLVCSVSSPTRGNAAVTQTESATIVVNAVESFPSTFPIVVYELTGPTSTSVASFIGSPVTISDLAPGTYTINAMDLGGIIDEPQAGSATVTVGPGETVEVEIQLTGVVFMPLMPLFF